VSDQDFTSMRAAMVASQLRTNSVSDPAVVAAMESVAREKFVPADRAALAYVDVPVPLGRGRWLNAPLVTGRLLVESGVGEGDKVMLIGSATGYAAALLSHLGATVVAVEEDAILAAAASQALEGVANVSAFYGLLSGGCPAQGPYDAIIIDGAVEQVPQPLWSQLREGGVLATGLRERGVTRLGIGRRIGHSCTVVPFIDVEAAPLPGFDLPRGFTF
jgi:protein-L-isoaspartate(D-aspartate) O-methyltransferase